MARITMERDPTTGKLKGVNFCGKTHQQVADQIANVLSDISRGVFIEPEKITAKEWKIIWLNEYKKPSARARTFDSYESLIDTYIDPNLGHNQISITLDLYSHVSHDVERKAMERLNTVFKIG